MNIKVEPAAASPSPLPSNYASPLPSNYATSPSLNHLDEYMYKVPPGSNFYGLNLGPVIGRVYLIFLFKCLPPTSIVSTLVI